MIQLWPHQQQSIDLLRKALASGKRKPMLQVPTGGGKTRTAGAIVELMRQRDKRAVFIVDAISLIDQTVQSFYDLGLSDIGVIQADHAMTDWSKPIQVASVQTLQRRGMPEVDLAIVDEAHVRNQWLEKQFGSEDWGKKPVIGLSATPWSKGLGLIYDELIAPITMRGLIEQGRLRDRNWRRIFSAPWIAAVESCPIFASATIPPAASTTTSILRSKGWAASSLEPERALCCFGGSAAVTTSIGSSRARRSRRHRRSAHEEMRVSWPGHGCRQHSPPR